MIKSAFNPAELIQPRRKITGMSAILLPFLEDGSVDWASFAAHLARTTEAGLTPAVNMDTGYVNLLDDATRSEVLQQTHATVGGHFVAGAFVADQPGAAWNLDAYRQRIEQIQQYGGTPIIFQNYGLTSQTPEAIVASYEQIGKHAPRFIAFELGTMFAPFGKIYDLDVYRGLLDVPQCIGAKHSSLSRVLEWERLQLRNEHRPDFMVMTGNDLAIDMVMYGSDYLLGLSTFAPDLFAKRDAMWAEGDPAFYELNDVLQYLGFLAFRPPVPAYKHSAAQFLKLRGWIKTNRTHPNSPARPESDIAILQDIAQRLGVLEGGAA
ncbi:dihydrodipicolinate synthase family protein [Phototrophicus methaneseepsis]|uniref:Dihydrodipicolinate synthase family protein n=1 Tax=Phototrophicus methaneseepsis TaxID=2710758 RepID=A0A7S8ECB5_9CHLR|nr:dihydrodipicolinate synthase family protein [Phototrophicus methaneseepsis]QPC84113.1 dihydrodipicolinate synthase family protein [Phototrophicus methaneseepsis]